MTDFKYCNMRTLTHVFIKHDICHISDGTDTYLILLSYLSFKDVSGGVSNCEFTQAGTQNSYKLAVRTKPINLFPFTLLMRGSPKQHQAEAHKQRRFVLEDH